MEDLKQIQEFFSKPLEEGTLDQVGVNEAFTPSSIFTKDPNNPNFLKITIPYDVGSGFSTALGKRTMSGQTRDMGSKTAMIKANQIAKQLESMFDLEDIDVTDQQNGKVEIFAVSDDFESKSSSEIKAELNTLMNEEKIEVDKDTKFQLDLTHLLDKHVVKEIAEEVMKEKGYSKYLVSKDNPKGETPGLTDDVLSKILMKIGDEVKETIELGKNLEERKKKRKKKKKTKDRCHRRADAEYGSETSAYKSGAIVRCRQGKIWKKNTNERLQEIIQESLRDWFKKEKWVRISTTGKIAGECGEKKKQSNPKRCLPKAKAQSLTKAERAKTARKKKTSGKKGKQFVSNTKKAKYKKGTYQSKKK